jgi:hypothetical protein
VAELVAFLASNRTPAVAEYVIDGVTTLTIKLPSSTHAIIPAFGPRESGVSEEAKHLFFSSQWLPVKRFANNDHVFKLASDSRPLATSSVNGIF